MAGGLAGVPENIWKIVALLASVMQPGSAAASPAMAPLAVQCSVAGAKYVAPAMSGAEVCARFGRALGAGLGRPVRLVTAAPADGLAVAIALLPQGVARARVTRLRAGTGQAPRSQELAVSDRRLSGADIDRLAADVAAGMMGT